MRLNLFFLSDTNIFLCLFLSLISFQSTASPADEAESIVNSGIYREAKDFENYLEQIDYPVISQFEPIDNLTSSTDKKKEIPKKEIIDKLLFHINNLVDWHNSGQKNKTLTPFQLALIELRLGYLYQYTEDAKKEKTFFYLVNAGEYFVKNTALGNPLHSIGLNALFDAYIWRGPLSKLQEIADKIIDPLNINGLAQGLTSQDKDPMCSAEFKAFSNYHLANKLGNNSFEISKQLVYLSKKCKSSDDQKTVLELFASDAFIANHYTESINAYKQVLKSLKKNQSNRKIQLELELAQVFQSQGNKKAAIQILKSAQKTCGLKKDCFKNFDILFTINTLNDRKDLNKQLLLKEISKTISDFNLFDLFERLSILFEEENKLKEAIFFQKIAISHASKSYIDMIAALDENKINFNDLVVKLFESGYRRLEKLLIDDDRLPEADEIMSFLKSSEISEFTRGDEFLIPNVLDKYHLTDQEQDWLKIYTDLKSREKLSYLPQALPIKNRINDFPRNTISSQKDLLLIQTNLNKLESTVLLRYYVNEKSLDTILTTSESQSSFRVNISKETLNTKINEFRALLKKPLSDPSLKAKELYEILFNTALREELTKRKPKLILLALDSNLRYLPFSALYDGKKYLIESITTELILDTKKGNLSPRQIIGDNSVGFGVTKPIAGFPKLPAVELEMKALESNQKNSKIFLDGDFNNKTLMSISETMPSIIHIASHFVFSPGNESNSYLLMGDGSKLTLREIRKNGFHFPDLNLLTLSACSTALGGGVDENGKEIDGFTDLMLKNGVKSVVATLWSVSDFGTGELMNNFYQAQHDKLNLSESLRQAQLRLLNNENKKLNSPYYWAPFILIRGF